MADKKPRKVTVGFQGGQSLALRLDQRDLDKLRQALSAGGAGWRELEADDGAVQLNLAQVVYLRVESDEHLVGFGA